jgi:uncharacterized SAM-binding protein YcdF (DUF218 family)
VGVELLHENDCLRVKIKRKKTRFPKRFPDYGRWLPGVGKRLKLASGAVVAFLLLWGGVTLYLKTMPLSNSDRRHFDAVVVLGVPAESNGTPSADQQAEVSEAVREYERGVASHIILSGGAAHNEFVEAKVMDEVARSQGIPESAILEEPRAQNTLENACYSVEIMKAHGWNSVEIIATQVRLPRAAYIFRRYPLTWSMHAAPDLPGTSSFVRWAEWQVEVLKMIRLLGYAQFMDHCPV